MKYWIMELCPEIAEWQAEMIAEQVQIRVAVEREECAKVCFYEWIKKPEPGTARDCWDAIRAREEE